MEGRHSRYVVRYATGSLNGTPSGVGLDTFEYHGGAAGVKEFDADVTNLSYLSYAQPIGEEKNWTVAAYRHELANYDADIFGAASACPLSAVKNMWYTLSLPGIFFVPLRSARIFADVHAIR